MTVFAGLKILFVMAGKTPIHVQLGQIGRTFGRWWKKLMGRMAVAAFRNILIEF